MAIVFTNSGNGSATKINENIGSGRLVLQAKAAHDDGSTAAISYSLTNDSSSSLSINALTGHVFLNENPDFESQDTYSFTVIASDANNQSAQQAFTLEVIDAIEGTSGDDTFSDETSGGVINGGDGNDSITYDGALADFELSRDASGNATVSQQDINNETQINTLPASYFVGLDADKIGPEFQWFSEFIA